MSAKKKERARDVPRFVGVVEKLAFSGEDDESHISIAQHRNLARFLKQARPSLGESHLPIDLVLDPLQIHSSPPHIYTINYQILKYHTWLIHTIN